MSKETTMFLLYIIMFLAGIAVGVGMLGILSENQFNDRSKELNLMQFKDGKWEYKTKEHQEMFHYLKHGTYKNFKGK